MKKKLQCLALGLSVGLVAASACSDGATAKTLRMASQGDATSLDPYSHNESFTNYFLSNIYDGLVARSKTFKIQGQLAESWKQKDALTWIFNLRKGVKFQDGSDFKADDVIFSFDRSRADSSNFKHVLTSVASYKALDDYTVEIKTKAPNPILLNDLLDLMILDKQWAKKNHAETPINLQEGEVAYTTDHANGTGPYKVVSRAKDTRTVLAANPNYWGKMGNVDKVVFTPIKNAQTMVSALLSGELDFVAPLPLQDVPRIERMPDLQVISGPEARTMYLGMDQARDELLESSVKGKNPFKDIRVRKAFAYAVDARAIVKRVMDGHATLATQYIMDKVTGFNPDLKRLPYDPKKAKALLAEAGYPKGFEVGFDCSTDRYVNDGQICQAVVGMLAKVGIKANLLAQPKAKFFPKIIAPKFETSLFLMSWTPSTMDGLNTFQNFLGTRDFDHGIGKWNISGYSRPEADKLWKAAAVEMDSAKREKMLQKAMKIMADSVSLVPLHVQQLVWAAKKNVDVVQLPTFEFPLEMFEIH